jgi:undecaprenyl-diphosphatase
MFLTTAALLMIPSILKLFKFERKDGEITYLTSIFMGVMQGFAFLPGLSRSGSTIAAGVASGAKRERVAEFTFLMSIPIIIASFVWELISKPHALGAIDPWNIVLGSLFAFVSAIFAIKFMLLLIKHAQLYWFSIYLVAIAIVSFVLFY